MTTTAEPRTELWQPIPWPPNLPEGETRPYEASNLGQIRSVPRTLANGRACGGTILKQRDHNRPKDAPRRYQIVNLSYGRKETWYVHQLVLLAFEGPPPPEKPLVRHLDDDPTNNYWAPGGEDGGTNLVYGTDEENIADRTRREREAKPAAPPKPVNPANPQNGHHHQGGNWAKCPECAVFWDTAWGTATWKIANREPVDERILLAAERQQRDWEAELERRQRWEAGQQRRIVKVIEEVNRLTVEDQTVEALKDVLDQGLQVSMSPPATIHPRSPRGRWARFAARYAPWRRRRRSTAKTDSSNHDCDKCDR